MTTIELYQQDIAELEAIQRKLQVNQPLTKEEREEAWWGLRGRINARKEEIRIHEAIRDKKAYVLEEVPIDYERPVMAE